MALINLSPSSMLLLIFFLCSCSFSQADSLTLPTLGVGADVSFIDEEEYWGVEFWDHGNKMDPLLLLANRGFTAIRLRLFVDPMAEGAQYSEQGYNTYRGISIPFCGLERTLAMAKRVKSLGLKLLLDFHYSDTWADPKNQHKPAQWRDLDLLQLKEKLYSYTQDSLLAFVAEGAPPDMVQIGNEIGGGFLWDPENPQRSGASKNWKLFTDLLNYASKAVRDTLPQAQIVIHHESTHSLTWFQGLVTSGVDFDLAGLSWYPQFGGTVSDLKENLSRFSKELIGKKVFIAEYSAQGKDLWEALQRQPSDRVWGAFIWEPVNWNDPRAENLFSWQEAPQRGHHTNSLMDLYDTLFFPRENKGDQSSLPNPVRLRL